MESIAELRRICRRENDEDNRKTMLLASRLSIYFTRIFLAANLSADQVTYIFITAGMAGALSFLGPGPWWAVAGYVMLKLHVIFDVCDGEVARYRKTSSAAGAYLDFLAHYCIYSLLLSAMTIRYFLDGGGLSSIVCGFVLVLANTLNRASCDCWFRANFGKAGRDEIEEGRDERSVGGLPNLLRIPVLIAANAVSIHNFASAYIVVMIMERYVQMDLRGYLIPFYTAMLLAFSIMRIARTISRGKIPRRATYYR